MAKGLFEDLGREFDAILKEGAEVLKDFDQSLGEVIKEADVASKINKAKEAAEEFIKDIEVTFEEAIREAQEAEKSTEKVYKIKVSDINHITIKFSNKNNSIKVKNEGSDKSFDIKLVDGISKKKVKKIINGVSYDKETSIISISVKRKNLRKD